MNWKNTKKTLIVVCALSLALLPNLIIGQDIVIIVNSENSVEELSKKKLKKIYSGKIKTWDDGTALKPIDAPPDDEIRKIFSKKVLKKSTKKVERMYMKNALSGKSQPPKQMKNYEDIISWVKENVGAIAYVPKSIMLKSGVKS